MAFVFDYVASNDVGGGVTAGGVGGGVFVCVVAS